MSAVDSILKSFRKTITKLERVAEQQNARANEASARMDAARIEAADARAERARADQIAEKLSKLIE